MNTWRRIPAADRRRIVVTGISFLGVCGVFVLALLKGDWAIGIPGLTACSFVLLGIARSVRETARHPTPVRPEVSPGVGLVTVFRTPARWRDALRAYRVIVDGQEVGSVRQGDQASFPVEPGDHSVELQIDWAKSDVVNLRAEAGEEVHLECRPGGLAAWLGGLFGKRGYIELTPPSPRRSGT